MYLRQHYHFGPLKISMYLKRYHDIEIGHSGVYRVLKRLELNRLPASQRYKRHTDRWKRYEKPLPGHRVQVDVKFIEPLPGMRKKKHYQYTAIDDCTRIRVLRIYPRNDQKTAIQFADYLLEKLPFQVEVIQTDNGAEFQGAFHWHLLDRGIGHVYIKPATPRLNGKVERSHRIDVEEFYRSRAPLPYRMRLDVVVGECVPQHSIVGEVHGDLEGAAQLMFDGDESSASAHAMWTIEMMQRPMRLAARFAHPLLRWGHDRVVEGTVDGFSIARFKRRR